MKTLFAFVFTFALVLSNAIAETTTNETFNPASAFVANAANSAENDLIIRAGIGVAETATNSIIPVAKGGTGVATVAAAKTALGIQSGQCVSKPDFLVTNTFATAFSAAPVVILTKHAAAHLAAGNDNTNAIVTSVTTTGFIANLGGDSVTNFWIAIGAP